MVEPARGRVAPGAVGDVPDPDLTQRQVLEVILGVAQDVMPNYTTHLADTQIDGIFEQFEWKTAG